MKREFRAYGTWDKRNGVPARKPRAYRDGYNFGRKNAVPKGDWPWGPRYRRIDFDAGWEDARADLQREWLAKWG